MIPQGMHRLALVALALTASCAGRAAAPTTPALAPALQPLAFYVGDWSCQGRVFATDAAPESTWTAAVHVRPDAGGGVLSVHMVGPGANRTAELKGVDPELGTWFHVWTSGDGGWGSLSGGWTGDALIAIDDRDVAHRTVFTKLSADQYSHRDEREDPTGAWKPVWEKVCTRD